LCDEEILNETMKLPLHILLRVLGTNLVVGDRQLEYAPKE